VFYGSCLARQTDIVHLCSRDLQDRFFCLSLYLASLSNTCALESCKTHLSVSLSCISLQRLSICLSLYLASLSNTCVRQISLSLSICLSRDLQDKQMSNTCAQETCKTHLSVSLSCLFLSRDRSVLNISLALPLCQIDREREKDREGV